MTKKSVIKRHKIITLAALGVSASFCIGLVYALSQIISHRYLQYGMYRLSAAILQEQLNKWFLVSLVTVAAVIFLHSAFLFLFSLISSILNRLSADTRDTPSRGVISDKLTAALACIVLSMVLVSTGWVVMGELSEGFFNSGSSVLLIVLLVWVFIQRTPKSLTYLVNLKALIALAILLCLNSGMLVAKIRPVTQRPNIILFVIDCLRPDHLGFHGYERQTSPAIDRLARNGMVCSNMYSNAPWTKPSVVTLFTSFYPQVHGILDPSQVLPNTALTIAELLHNSGYKTFFINGGNPFIDERFNFNQGFDYYQYLSCKIKSGIDVTSSLLSQIAEKRDDKFFAYVHYMDTHAPYTKNEYNNFFREQGDDQFVFTRKSAKCDNIRKLTASGELTEQHKKDIIALYDSQLRYVDENIRSILTFLKQEGLLENTVVIVTSDHGEEFWEHNNYEHGHTLYNEVLRVPLIISGANIKPSKITASVSLIDLMPTVLDIAGITSDSLNLQGVSLLKTVQHDDSSLVAPIFATGTLYGSEKYCLVRDNKKMIITTDRKERKWNLIGAQYENSCELYNMRDDAYERDNLINTHDGDRTSMEKDLASFTHMASAFQWKGEGADIVIDEGLKEKLSSLGYLEE
jgi:arylsulfatase A-like enzyme